MTHPRTHRRASESAAHSAPTSRAADADARPLASASRTATASTARLRALLALALAALLSLSALGGCSGAASPTESQAAPEPTAAANQSVPEGTGASANSASASQETVPANADGTLDPAQIPDWSGAPFVTVNNNEPSLSVADASSATESYSALDALGRCDVAFALVSPKTMPTEKRGSIGMVKPSGWHTVRYDDLIDGKYLYNRCHLIGYQLTGENANVRNLITGTRYLNVQGMLPFEDEIASYVEKTGMRVLYRSTPVFAGDELVARGVHLEALSIDDDGAGVRFNVFCYNVQPGIGIDYATGESWRANEAEEADASAAQAEPTAQNTQATQHDYVLNTNNKRFHLPECSSVESIKASNRRDYTGTRDELIAKGYSPCGRCNP